MLVMEKLSSCVFGIKEPFEKVWRTKIGDRLNGRERILKNLLESWA
jgi:hypothetical protein